MRDWKYYNLFIYVAYILQLLVVCNFPLLFYQFQDFWKKPGYLKLNFKEDIYVVQICPFKNESDVH